MFNLFSIYILILKGGVCFMKEATGELSMTVVTIIAIVAIAGIIALLKGPLTNYINSTWQQTSNAAIQKNS